MKCRIPLTSKCLQREIRVWGGIFNDENQNESIEIQVLKISQASWGLTCETLPQSCFKEPPSEKKKGHSSSSDSALNLKISIFREIATIYESHSLDFFQSLHFKYHVPGVQTHPDFCFKTLEYLDSGMPTVWKNRQVIKHRVY